MSATRCGTEPQWISATPQIALLVQARESSENQLMRRKTSLCDLRPIRVRGGQVMLQSWCGAASNPHPHIPR